MTAWFGAVWSRTLAESDKLIFGREKDMLKTGFAALGVISMIYSAFFFAIHDYGRVNIIALVFSQVRFGALTFLRPGSCGSFS
jgi:hypothetical protein